MDLITKKLFPREFEQRLQILTDLSPKDVQALHEVSRGLPLTAHPSTRNSLRDCFLYHHKGHEEHKGLTVDGINSCKSVKFVAEQRLKGVLAWLQTT